MTSSEIASNVRSQSCVSVPARINRALMRSRSGSAPDSCRAPGDISTEPSRTASTFSARAISGTVLPLPLNCMDDVREITLTPASRPSVPINSSVMPSAKYSCAGSPERFASGRMAMDRIGATASVAAVCPLRNAGSASSAPATIAAAIPATAAMALTRRRDDGRSAATASRGRATVSCCVSSSSALRRSASSAPAVR